MNDFFSSIGKWFKDRTTSPLYGTFVLSVILWNWKFFYILFWQSEDLFLIPKIEYVQKNILDQQSYGEHLLHFLGLPLLSTFIIIWWLPIFSNWAHKKHIDFYYKRRLIFDQAKLDYEKNEQKTLVSISTVKKEQAETKKEIQKNTSEEDQWMAEYKDFKNHFLYEKLNQLINVLYNNSGETHKWQRDILGRIIDPDILGTAHTKGLIMIEGTERTEKVVLTEKGKFFLARYFEDNSPQ